MRTVANLGKLERSVLEAVWTLGQGSVTQVSEALASELAYTTIMTTLDRLYKKGWLVRRREGRMYVYSPVLSKQETARSETRSFLNSLFQQQEDCRPLLSCLIETVSHHDHAALDELERMIQEKRREEKKSKCSRPSR